MCGIYAREETKGANEAWRMLQLMKHRGPDEQRVVSEAGFTVGHARLAIVDTKEVDAAQPARSAKGHIIAFNGEIYNYRSLLPSAPSEIALIATMLDERLDPRYYFDGDYAIIDFNPSQREVTLYRDRFGMCPLYYQLRPFVAVSSERRRLGAKHVYEVPAHGKVVIDLVKRKHRFSWIPHYGVTCTSRPIDENKIVRSLLLDAVRSRATHSDTGFSAALSGGLDSSAVVLACTALGMRPRSAIVVASPAKSDDLHYARLVAKRAKVALEVVSVTDAMLREEAPTMLEHLDLTNGVLPTPLKWRASLRNWFVAKQSRTRVILCGEGADEMIEGYPPHTINNKDRPYRLASHQLTATRSLPRLNLDRTNKLGLAHSKEYRAPFLASTLSYFLLSARRRVGKQILREVLESLGAPTELLSRPKWGSDEVYFDASMDRILKGETE